MAIPVWSTPRDSLNRFNLVFSRCPYEESPLAVSFHLCCAGIRLCDLCAGGVFCRKTPIKKQITTLSRGFLIGMPYRWLTSQSLSAKIMSSRSPHIQVVVMVISRSFLPFYSVIICRGSPDNKGKIGYSV